MIGQHIHGQQQIGDGMGDNTCPKALGVNEHRADQESPDDCREPPVAVDGSESPGHDQKGSQRPLTDFNVVADDPRWLWLHRGRF